MAFFVDLQIKLGTRVQALSFKKMQRYINRFYLFPCVRHHQKITNGKNILEYLKTIFKYRPKPRGRE